MNNEAKELAINSNKNIVETLNKDKIIKKLSGIIIEMEHTLIEVKEAFIMKDYAHIEKILGVYQKKYRKSIRKRDIIESKESLCSGES